MGQLDQWTENWQVQTHLIFRLKIKATKIAWKTQNIIY